MKKLFPFLFVSILVLTSCNKDDGDDGGSVDVAPFAGTYTGYVEYTQYNCFGDDSNLGESYYISYKLEAHNGGYKVGEVDQDGNAYFDWDGEQDGEQPLTLNAAGSGSYSVNYQLNGSTVENSTDFNIVAGALQVDYFFYQTEPTLGECVTRFEGTLTK